MVDLLQGTKQFFKLKKQQQQNILIIYTAFLKLTIIKI